MARFIFINHNQYDVFVPTPNGAGRRVKVGEAVEGDFFIDVANTGILSRYADDPTKVNIICEYRLNSYLQAARSAQAQDKVEQIPTPTEAEQAAQPPIVEAAPPPPAAPLTLDEKELYKLSMDELRFTAASKGLDVETSVGKRALVKMIVAATKK